MKHKKIYTYKIPNKAFIIPLIILIFLFSISILGLVKDILNTLFGILNFRFNFWFLLFFLILSIPIAFLLCGIEGVYWYVNDKYMQYIDESNIKNFREFVKCSFAYWKRDIYLLPGPKIHYDEIVKIDIYFHTSINNYAYSIDIKFYLKNGEVLSLSHTSLGLDSQLCNHILWLKDNHNIQINDPYNLLNAPWDQKISLITYLDTIMQERGLRNWIRK